MYYKISLLWVLVTCVYAAEPQLVFETVDVPITDEAKRQILTSPSVIIDGKSYPVQYNTILRSGETLGSHTFGQLVDVNAQPILMQDGKPIISNSNDFSSLMPVDDKLFMLSHFESRPGAMYLTELAQNNKTGTLTAIATRPIDFSAIKGGWVHCAGSVTPWHTHLGSEEYEPDAEQHDANTGQINSYYEPMAKYYGGNLHKLNPYDYGHIIEVKVLDAQGTTEVSKHYAMGRLAFELAYVMPDEKTVYLSDDGTNVGLFMFIADKRADLSAGTLYAAHWKQISADNGGQAELSWIQLGHLSNAEVQNFLDDKITFNDIFSKETPDSDNQCQKGFTSINVGHQADKYGNYQRCLKLKPGMEKAAIALETRRYAAMLGATTEFRKGEGLTFNPDTQQLYFAISEVSKGMEDNASKGKANPSFDVGGFNHIRLPYNKCGTIFSLDLDYEPMMGSHYVAQNMQALVSGKKHGYTGELAANQCDVNGIANPDNITYVQGYQTLIIGEDTGSGHQNDMVWAYHLGNKTLTRIQTTPYGSETTGVYFYPNINGWAYLMSVVQHPYGESDQDKAQGIQDTAAYTGYLGAFPAMQ